MHENPTPESTVPESSRTGCDSRADVCRLDVLTPRQMQVAELVATGMTNRMIARRLSLSEWTVVNHLRQVMAKLDCPTRLHVALVVTAIRC